MEINMKDENKDKPDKDPKLVTVTVDDNDIEIERGKYIVSDFKSKVRVPADYDLDQLIKGKFETLADTAEVKINGKEIFVSHVRTGGSSSD
jgi:ATP-dependent phosphoenolpyruvate carboxykinase